MKKRIIVTLLWFVVDSFFLLVFTLLLLPPCERRYASKISSPSNQYNAFVGDSNCHSTTPYIANVKVSELLLGFTIPYITEKAIFSYRGTINDVDIAWINQTTLKISYKDCREIYRQDDSWKGIKIIYEERCRDNP